jgi:hypothetical protein
VSHLLVKSYKNDNIAKTSVKIKKSDQLILDICPGVLSTFDQPGRFTLPQELVRYKGGGRLLQVITILIHT